MEEDLIRQAQAGNQAAFQQLVVLYNSILYRAACAMLNEPGLAEDAVQETWLDVWRGLPRFEIGRPLKPWLLTILANRCRKAMRGYKAHNLPLDAAIGQELSTLPNSEDRGLQSIHHPLLSDLLDDLEPTLQNLLALRFFAGLELEEIATLTNTPIGTVKSRLHRTLVRLRNQMAKPSIPGLNNNKR